MTKYQVVQSGKAFQPQKISKFWTLIGYDKK